MTLSNKTHLKLKIRDKQIKLLPDNYVIVFYFNFNILNNIKLVNTLRNEGSQNNIWL